MHGAEIRIHICSTRTIQNDQLLKDEARRAIEAEKVWRIHGIASFCQPLLLTFRAWVCVIVQDSKRELSCTLERIWISRLGKQPLQGAK